jgi:cobalamin-dependent methionine synthase I
MSTTTSAVDFIRAHYGIKLESSSTPALAAAISNISFLPWQPMLRAGEAMHYRRFAYHAINKPAWTWASVNAGCSPRLRRDSEKTCSSWLKMLCSIRRPDATDRTPDQVLLETVIAGGKVEAVADEWRRGTVEETAVPFVGKGIFVDFFEQDTEEARSSMSALSVIEGL